MDLLIKNIKSYDTFKKKTKKYLLYTLIKNCHDCKYSLIGLFVTAHNGHYIIQTLNLNYCMFSIQIFCRSISSDIKYIIIAYFVKSL